MRLILGLRTRSKLLPTWSLALLRHAFHHLYYDLTQVEIHNRTFVWQSTLHHTLATLRDALIRIAHKRQIEYTSLVYSADGPPPAKEFPYKLLIDIDNEGSYSLTDHMTDALSDTEAEARKAFDELAHTGKRKRKLAATMPTRMLKAALHSDDSDSSEEISLDHTDYLNPSAMEWAADPDMAISHINSLQFMVSGIEARFPAETHPTHRIRILDIEEEKHTELNSVRDNELSLSESEDDVVMTE